MTITTCDRTLVEISPHALQRFRDRGRRVFPGGQLDSDVRAHDLLRYKLRRAGIRKRRPGWTYGTANLTHQHLTHGYLVINEAVAFPLQRINGRLVATTCLVRSWNRETTG